LDQAALGFVAELFEALAEVLEARVALVLLETLGEFLLQLLDLLGIAAAGDAVDD
jgi:hypothetical protein